MKPEYPRNRAPKTFVKWTPEMDAEIIRLTIGRNSASKIAKVFGVTRNAIIGRIYRLRRNGHEIPAHNPYKHRQWAPVPPRTRQRRKPATLVVPGSKSPSVALPEAGNGKRPIRIPRVLPKPVEIPTGELCGILDLKKNGCKYPVTRDEKTVGKHLFCNAEKAGNVPYCSHHLAVTWKAV